MEAKGNHFSAETRRVGVELWKAKVPLKNIRGQLQMSTAIPMHLLAHAKDHPDQPVKPWKMVPGLQNHKIMDSTRT
jgi:hypothetical protein